MKRLVALMAVVAFLAVAMVAFGMPAAPTGDIEIVKAEGGSKPPVSFSHVKHAAAVPDCVTCHHTSKVGGAIEKCSACHKAEKDGKKLSSKDAAHKTCRGCHKNMKDAGKKTGPTPCTGCHKK